MPCPSDTPLLNHSNYTWRRVQIMKLLLQFSATSCQLISLFGRNILLNTIFSNTLSLRSFLNIRDQVSHPYRTTGKIKFLYIPIFMFLDSRREDKSSGLNGRKCYPSSISS
jgi:hypothetical protein